MTQKISAARKKRFNTLVVFALGFLLGYLTNGLFCRGKSAPILALFGDTTANASDDEDGDALPPASSATSSDVATTDDNPF